MSNDFGELCSDRSYGFHEWLPNTLDLPGHRLPMIRLDEHIQFSVNRKAGGFYLFSETSIYRLHIRNKSTEATHPSDDETVCIRLCNVGTWHDACVCRRIRAEYLATRFANYPSAAELGCNFVAP